MSIYKDAHAILIGVICNTHSCQYVVNTSFDTLIHQHYRHHLQQDHQASFAKSSCENPYLNPLP